MERFSKEFLELIPHRGKDLETTRRPASGIAIPRFHPQFIEGTRFTPEKHARQAPVPYPLKPKAGASPSPGAWMEGSGDSRRHHHLSPQGVDLLGLSVWTCREDHGPVRKSRCQSSSWKVTMRTTGTSVMLPAWVSVSGGKRTTSSQNTWRRCLIGISLHHPLKQQPFP